MPEITAGDEAAVADFILNNFQHTQTSHPMSPGAASSYARIAAFLSDGGQVKTCLGKVSAAVEAEYRQLTGADTKTNVLTRAIINVANSRGWTTQKNVVLQGFIQPGDIVKYVRKKIMWKDAVSSLHGEFSHSLQWLAVSAFANGNPAIPQLYANSVDYRSTIKFKRPTGQPTEVHLWDFLVDCFNFGGDPDYKTSIITHTCRSPAGLMKFLMNSCFDLWIAAILRDRYHRKGWPMPDGKGSQVDLATYARGAHMTGNIGKKGYTARASGNNYVLKRADAQRTDRNRADRGFQSLQGKLFVEPPGVWGVPKIRTNDGAVYSCNTSQIAIGELRKKADSSVTFELWPDATGNCTIASNLIFPG